MFKHELIAILFLVFTPNVCLLQVMDGEEVTIKLQEPLSPTLLMESGNKDYTCVVMPMRTREVTGVK